MSSQLPFWAPQRHRCTESDLRLDITNDFIIKQSYFACESFCTQITSLCGKLQFGHRVMLIGDGVSIYIWLNKLSCIVVERHDAMVIKCAEIGLTNTQLNKTWWYYFNWTRTLCWSLKVGLNNWGGLYKIGIDQ